MNAQSTFTAVLVAGFILACIVYDLRRGLYRLLSPRTAVLISVIYWYLLEALRLPKDLASFTQLEYDFGMFCVVLATLRLSGRLPRNSRTALRSVHTFDADARAAADVVDAGRLRRDDRLRQHLVVHAVRRGRAVRGPHRDAASLVGLARSRAHGSWSTIVYELQVFLPAVVPLAIALASMKRAPTRYRWFCACS